MGCYVTKDMTLGALSEMKGFYTDLLDLYRKYEINLEEDLGRRNMLMSSLQEKTFAKQIKVLYPSTFSDGKTGEPDIVISEIDAELECKLTSKNKSGSWALQTDYNTLRNKGSLDYLYVLASRDFSEFAVLFFEKLTCDDFHPPASGSKGKSRMKVASAIRKCTILHGDIIDNGSAFIEAALNTIGDESATPSQLEKAKKRYKYWKNNTSISFELRAA